MNRTLILKGLVILGTLLVFSVPTAGQANTDEGCCFCIHEDPWGVTGCVENVTTSDCQVAEHAGSWAKCWYVADNDCTDGQCRCVSGSPECTIDDQNKWRYLNSVWCKETEAGCVEVYAVRRCKQPG